MDTKFQGLKRQNEEPYVTMRGGHRVDILNPKAHQIRIDDIAWHLARQCRFTGHVQQWYSTAEHCILGARKATTPKLAREFLIHDAAEYVFNDLASPVKRLCPSYCKLIDDFQHFLNRHFLEYQPEHTDLKEIDSRICATEMRVLRGTSDDHLEAVPYDDVRFYCWRWQDAHVRFLDMFTWLFPEYKDVEGVLGDAAPK